VIPCKPTSTNRQERLFSQWLPDSAAKRPRCPRCPPGPLCPQGPPGPQQHFHQLKQIALKLEKTKQLPFTLIDTQTTRTSMSITDNTLWVKSKSLSENTIWEDPDIMQRHLLPLPPITSWEEVFFWGGAKLSSASRSRAFHAPKSNFELETLNVELNCAVAPTCYLPLLFRSRKNSASLKRTESCRKNRSCQHSFSTDTPCTSHENPNALKSCTG